MAELRNAHGSLLSFVSSIGDHFNIEGFNLDAISDEVDLPDADFVGLQNFALASANDYQPFALVSGMITVGSYNDTNNMRLIELLDYIYEELQPERLLPFFSMTTGEEIGGMKLFGTTRVLPIQRSNTLALQSITFQAALQYVE